MFYRIRGADEFSRAGRECQFRMMKKPERRGREAFLRRYQEAFGERFPGLLKALEGPPDSLEYSEGLTVPYRMDRASILAALSLPLPEEGRLLDACAAPGGKSLVLASRITDRPGLSLTCNELSADRRRRLRDVLDSHLPAPLLARVTVTGFDAAARARRERDAWDSILLDAPCSSERHVLASPTHLALWSEARVRNLAARQWALLSAAFLLLKPGGDLVYSTCALSPEENDGVAGRLASKYGDRVQYKPILTGEAGPESPVFERTKYGILVLPDMARGAGPMYICRVRKA